jgi:hypothetical protein
LQICVDAHVVLDLVFLMPFLIYLYVVFLMLFFYSMSQAIDLDSECLSDDDVIVASSQSLKFVTCS